MKKERTPLTVKEAADLDKACNHLAKAIRELNLATKAQKGTCYPRGADKYVMKKLEEDLAELRSIIEHGWA